MKSSISATEAARNFSELLNRVRYRGEEFVIERGGEPIGRVIPMGAPGRTLRELAQLLAEMPKPDRGFAAAVEGAVRKQAKVPKSPWGS